MSINLEHHLRLLLLLNLRRDLLLLHVDILLLRSFFEVECCLILAQDIGSDVVWRFEEVPVDVTEWVLVAGVDEKEDLVGVIAQDVLEFGPVPVLDVGEAYSEVEKDVVNDLGAAH